MANGEEQMSCSSRCWIAAAVLGVLIALILVVFAGWGFWGALLLGIVIFAAAGILLTRAVCTDASASIHAPSVPEARPTAAEAPPPAAPEAAAVDAEDLPANSPAAVAPAADPEAVRLVKPSVALPGQQDLSSRKGSWSYRPEADPRPTQFAEAAAPPPTPPQPAATAGDKPQTLDAPRGGAADNLKKIRGVGPKLEALLHSMGVYHYDQIAGWSDREVAWVDQNLVGFKGRVSRDNWVDQARVLSEGGDTDFSKRVDKGGVYD